MNNPIFRSLPVFNSHPLNMNQSALAIVENQLLAGSKEGVSPWVCKVISLYYFF